jgi:hypothetical protein
MTIFSLQKKLVETDDTLEGVVMTISFYSLKAIIFFDFLTAFFKKLAGQTYLPQFLRCKGKFCSAPKKRLFMEEACCPDS